MERVRIIVGAFKYAIAKTDFIDAVKFTLFVWQG